MRKKFIIFLIILTSLLGMVGFYYWNSNSYSKEVLKLEILAPEEVEIAEDFEYLVKYKNNGKICLEEPKLIFEYPEYSIVEGNILRKEIVLDDIYPGEERTYPFKARLLGREGQSFQAKVSLSYQVKNLKARYESNTTFTTIINSVPLNFDFDLPSKIKSGGKLKFTLNYFSNINYPISNLRCKIEYPSGFEFIESEPQSLEKVEWEIPGSLNKAEGGRIEITGEVRGEIGDEKTFQAEFGSWQNGEFILLKKAVKGVEIIRPALYIVQQINGSPEYVASPGDLLHYEIFFKNIGEEALIDMPLQVTLSGTAFDLTTLRAPDGEYETGDNSILWDWRRVRDLQFLDVQKQGKVDFWIKLKDEWEISSSKGEEMIKDKIYLSQAREEFTTKVNSKLEIIQKGYFEDEVFGNSGPLPPKINEPTTYTIIWQIKNHYNDVQNVKVKAILPENVKLTGSIFPEKETEKLFVDSESQEIIWHVGELKTGHGVLAATNNETLNVAFQIAFTPNSSQRNQTPEIIGQAKVEGEDMWTKEILTETAININTTLPDDPTVTADMGKIQ